MHVRALFPLVLLVGCIENEPVRLVRTDEFQQAPSNLVDILWVIDNSTSMANEQAALEAAAADFVGRLEHTEMDFHLGVITTDVDQENPDAGVLLGDPQVLTNTTPGYADAFSARVRQGEDGSDQEKGLQAAIAAVSSPLAYTANAGFLREGAMLSVVILSDENDCSDDGALGPSATGEDCYVRATELTPVTDLVRELVAVKEGDPVVVSGIIGPEIAAECGASVPGRRYSHAIQLLGGVQANICESDYAPIMEAVGDVASGILTVFQLSRAAVADSISVEVRLDDAEEAVEVPEDAVEGWTYLAEYAQIEFHGVAIPERGAHIEVRYQVSGQVLPSTEAAP